MPSFDQRLFAGMRLSVDDKTVEARFGTVAHNTLLRDGTLKPYMEGRLALAAPNARTIWRFNDNLACCGPIKTWDTCVYVLSDFPAPGTCHEFEHHVLFYQDCAQPPQRYFPCADTYFPLLVAAPQRILTASLLASGILQNAPYAGPDARSYTYTWVDDFSTESAPALPSQIVKSYDDETWRLTGFDTPPANATHVRIYRASSFFETGEQVANPYNTSFQLVEEVALPFAGFYDDNRKLLDLDYGTLQTEENCDPPCMTQVAATESGYAVGFKGNDIYFSERYEPHNWPTKFRTTLAHKIVAIAVQGDIVFAATTGVPYRINTAPTQQRQPAELDLTIDPLPYDENFPCLARHSMVATNFGAMYSSRKGLVALQLRGTASLITRDRVDEDEWPRWSPNLAAWWNGKYIGVKNPTGRAFVLDVIEGAEGQRLDLGDFVTVDMDAFAIKSARDGRLYYATPTGVFAFNEGLVPMPYEYRTKTFRFAALVGMTAAKVVAHYGPPVQFELYAEDRLVYTKSVTNSKPFRLPHFGRFLDFQVRLTGTTRVRELHVGTSVFDLTEERQTS